MALVVDVLQNAPDAAPGYKVNRDSLARVQQFLSTMWRLRGELHELSAAERVAVADSLFAISSLALGLQTPLGQWQLHWGGSDALVRQTRDFRTPILLALAQLQHELVQFLSAEQNHEALSAPLPVGFLAQRNEEAYITELTSMEVPTWRALLA